MADNTYVLEDIVEWGNPVIADDGTGIDWLVVRDVHLSGAGHWGVLIEMYHTDPLSTEGFYDIDDNGTPARVGLTIYGQIENAQGGGGEEYIIGGIIANLIVGDPMAEPGGNDILFGGGGNDTLIGCGGNDDIAGDNDDDLIFGDGDPAAAGESFFLAGDDTLSGGNGNDTLVGGGGTNDLNGGDGLDVADYSGFFDGSGNISYRIVVAGEARVYATDSSTGVETSIAIDALFSIEGVIGTGGDDLIWGAASVFGGAGDDTIHGSYGADSLYGGDGADILHDGGNPDDGAQADLLFGGAGRDHYVVTSATTIVAEVEDNGIDRVVAFVDYALAANVENLTLGAEGLVARIGTGNPLDNQMTGNAAANFLYGLAGRDDLDGGKGEDFLSGGVQGDSLFGGGGDDTLAGGKGADQLRGGDGSDIFRFTHPGTGTGRDLIVDFRTAIDSIDLHRLARDQVFIQGENFHQIAGEIRCADGILSGDIDGNGKADYRIELASAPPLAAADLIL